MNRNVHVPFLGEGAVVTLFSLTRHFLTTSDGKHYGAFHGKLRERQKRDREKRRRKAKSRRCLEKKGVKKLPSTSSKSGQRLARHVRQSINRAVNQCFTEHPDAQFAYEHLSVATMKYKARAMCAYLYASNLAHIPKQLAWNAARCAMVEVPTRHCVRADPANESSDGNAPHEEDAMEAKLFAGSSQAEAPRRVARASRVLQVRRSARPATSTQRIGPSLTGPRSTEAGGGKRRRTRLSRRARLPLAAFRLDTALGEHIVDNRSGRRDRRHALVKAFS